MFLTFHNIIKNIQSRLFFANLKKFWKKKKEILKFRIIKINIYNTKVWLLFQLAALIPTHYQLSVGHIFDSENYAKIIQNKSVNIATLKTLSTVKLNFTQFHCDLKVPEN